jgi:hypothetical protein
MEFVKDDKVMKNYLLCESYTFILRKQFYFVFSGLKIIGHWNHDNNLESLCISSISIPYSAETLPSQNA